MKHTAQEKKLADDARLLRAWKNFHREEKNAALAGPYSATLVELFRMFSNIECVQPSQLADWFEAGVPQEWRQLELMQRFEPKGVGDSGRGDGDGDQDQRDGGDADR